MTVTAKLLMRSADGLDAGRLLDKSEQTLRFLLLVKLGSAIETYGPEC